MFAKVDEEACEAISEMSRIFLYIVGAIVQTVSQ